MRGLDCPRTTKEKYYEGESWGKMMKRGGDEGWEELWGVVARTREEGLGGGWRLDVKQ